MTTPWQPKPPSWQPKEPPTPDWTTNEYLVQNDFDALAARRIELKDKRDAIDEELEELDPQLGAMIATTGLNSVRFGYHRFTLSYRTKGGTISKERLLEAGVTPEQLERATSPKTIGGAYVRVTAIKGPED